VGDQVQGPFQTHPADERGKRLTNQSAKHPMKVVGREAGDSCNVFQPERIRDMARDVVNSSVDPIDVVWIRKIWQVGHG